MIAVIEGGNNFRAGIPDNVWIYPETHEGRKESREKFCELVGEVLSHTQEMNEDEAKLKAQDYLDPQGSKYTFGDDSYISLHENCTYMGDK